MRAPNRVNGSHAVYLCLMMAWLTATPVVARAAGFSGPPDRSPFDLFGGLVGTTINPSTGDCAAIAETNFSEIQDAATRVTSANVVEASGDMPAYCRVQGHVMPSVGFELRLPMSNWNGKFFEVGCGGFCGNISQTACDDPLRRGYACIASDMGTKSGRIDALVFYNNLQAQIDFGFRGAHVTALAGKAITEHFYGRAPNKSYFHGCSSGGQQALSEAQRFPWDFDGIISGAPSPTFSGPMMYYEWSGRQLLGTISPDNLKLVYDRAMAECDANDGLKDGIINDPPACKFDPADLLCRAADRTGCLTSDQIEAVKKVYAGPTTSKGEKIYTGGPMVGSEQTWFGSMQGVAYYGSSGINPYPIQFFRYVGFMPAQGPGGKYIEFDFDRDYKRLGMAEALFGNANNPDLRKFAAAGGKLIMYNGWADNSDIPSDAIDYYDTTERTMGGRAATQEFFRLFMVPGMYHCRGGPGAFAIDYLSYLEAWVERGEAPDVVIGAHPDSQDPAEWGRFPLDPAKVSFTRPVYPYPVQVVYNGSGDPNDAAHFRPVSSKYSQK
jgi:hypothetical protein